MKFLLPFLITFQVMALTLAWDVANPNDFTKEHRLFYRKIGESTESMIVIPMPTTTFEITKENFSNGEYIMSVAGVNDFGLSNRTANLQDIIVLAAPSTPTNFRILRVQE